MKTALKYKGIVTFWVIISVSFLLMPGTDIGRRTGIICLRFQLSCQTY